MQIKVICKNCYKPISLTNTYSNRYDMQDAEGAEFEVRCLKCEATNKYTVENAYAETDFKMIICFLIAVVLCLILLAFSFLLGITIAPIIGFASSIYIRNMNKNIDIFNSTHPNSNRDIKLGHKFE